MLRVLKRKLKAQHHLALKPLPPPPPLLSRLYRTHLDITPAGLIPQSAIDQNILVTLRHTHVLRTTHGKGPKHHCTSLATEQHGSVDDSSTRRRSPSHVPSGVLGVHRTTARVNLLWRPHAAVNGILARGTIRLTVVNVFSAVLMPTTQ